MNEEDHNAKPHPARALAPAIIALVFIVLIARFLPSGPRPTSDEANTSHSPRARVVIFLVDTTDYFAAHGDGVRSVIRRHCPQCDVQPANLHGDLSLPNIIYALRQVHRLSQAHEAETTTLVNLSLGTYTYDETLHAIVRKLDAEGVVLLASAGNDNRSKRFYPAAFPEVLGICSTTRYNKTKATYSNFGDWVSLCAPGLQYVTRPLQHGELARGTSFSSPMVTGILGQLLLNAPCASPRAGRRALLRTADPVEVKRYALGAGLLDAAAAGQYLRHLYPCQQPRSFLQRQFAWLERQATQVGISLAVILYFFVSIFTLPFMLAFTLDRLQRRAEQRRQQAILQAYTGSLNERRQRLLTLKQSVLQRQKVRRREQGELLALLHALHIHGEPCWWCERPAAEPVMDDGSYNPEVSVCSRCGLEPQASLAGLKKRTED